MSGTDSAYGPTTSNSACFAATTPRLYGISTTDSAYGPTIRYNASSTDCVYDATTHSGGGPPGSLQRDGPRRHPFRL
eukprot:3202824-Rhodomonas_salina.1